MQLLRVHVGAQDGVDASLVAALLPKPAEQVGVFLNLDREISFPNTRFHARATSAQLSPWGLRFCANLLQL